MIFFLLNIGVASAKLTHICRGFVRFIVSWYVSIKHTYICMLYVYIYIYIA